MSVHKGKTTVINSASILLDPLHVAVSPVTLWMPMCFLVQVSPSVNVDGGIMSYCIYRTTPRTGDFNVLMMLKVLCRQAYKRLANVVLTVTKDHMRLL